MPDPGEGGFRQTIREGHDGPILGEWVTEDLEVVARKVCEPCNNGWMKDLEDAVESRFLPSLIQGRGRTLYEEGQALLAAWATKTALALQLATPDTAPIPTAQYREIAERKTAPPGRVQVWIGGYDGWRHGFFDPKHLTLRTAGGDFDAYQATVLLGRVIFQVFGHTCDDEVSVSKQGARGDMTARIWPVTAPVVWPPPLIVTEDSLRFLIEGFEVRPR